MNKIVRHTEGNTAQGVSFWSYPEPVVIVMHDEHNWYTKTEHIGWCSFSVTPNIIEDQTGRFENAIDEFIQGEAVGLVSLDSESQNDKIAIPQFKAACFKSISDFELFLTQRNLDFKQLTDNIEQNGTRSKLI